VIRAHRVNATAQDDASLVSGWNIAPNVAYTLRLLPGAASCGIFLYSEVGALVASGAALVGTEQPCILTPQTGQAIGMVDSDFGWHLLITTIGTESQREIRINPAVDLPDEIHPIYGDDDMGLARATAAIDAAAHYIDDLTVSCPLGLGAGLGDVVSVPVDGVAVVGQVESITWTATPDGVTEQAVIRRHVAIAPEAFVEPVPITPPVVADDTGTTDAVTITSGNVLTNDEAGLTVVAVNGLSASVGVAVDGNNGGVFTIAADGAWTFYPDGDFALLAGAETADTSVTYYASDGVGESSATLTVTVSAAPQEDAYTSLQLKFDGSFVDDSQNGLVATVGGNAAIDTLYPKFGAACLTLDGSGDYIEYPASALFEISSGDFTIEFWYRPTTLTNNADNVFDCFFASCEPNAETLTYWAFLYSNTRVLYFRNVAGQELITPVASGFVVGTWYHLAYVRDGSVYRLYKNGVQISTGTGTIGNTQRMFRIGSLSRTVHAANGRFDNFRFSKGICRYPGGTTFTPAQL
jgi:VCBS repeat-containing protein